ncbi:hypothetical protein F4782DRAFT_535690 [Xylaria castorea]|nr:hypothetical protein F4782DRAFT_535690 [Xylaria castorea]
MSESERALELARPSTFCKAIFFLYACGCRTPEPFFCCRPCPDVSPGVVPASNPCRHETPSVVLAKLPHACKTGKTEACVAVDPALLEFVREVDTAERLDLVILSDIPRDEINTTLPERVDGEFTVGQIAARYLNRRRNPPAFSPDIAPFVPRSCVAASLPTPASVRGDVMALKDLSNAVGNILSDGTEERINGVERDGEYQQDGESENLQNDCVIAEETVRERAIQPVDDNSEGSEEFVDIELLAPTHSADSESSISRAEHTPKPEEPESSASATDIRGYDDMMMFWSLDDNETARKIETASCWCISSLFSKFTNRRF